MTGIQWRFYLRALLFIAVILGGVAVAFGDRPGRLDRDTRAALRPGLVTALRSDIGEASADDWRVDRMPALYVAEGGVASPLLPSGAFGVTWSGLLKTRLRGEFRFRFDGVGHARLVVNGEAVLEEGPGRLGGRISGSVELAKGYNRLEVLYASGEGTPARFRLDWSGEDFPFEPVNPAQLVHDSRHEQLMAGQQLRRGRDLFARHHCQQCHGGSVVGGPEGASMPELAGEPPNLGISGSRLRAEWVAAWVLDPRRLRNHTTMPQLLETPRLTGDTAAGEIAADLAAYVTSLGAAAAKDAGTAAADSETEQGMTLYEHRGCIGCHRFTPPDAEDEFDRVSLFFAAAKFRPGRLAEFLQDTTAHYPWSRMPKFELTSNEAAAIESWIRSEANGRLERLRVGDADRGAKAFTAYRCDACHAESPGRSPAGKPDSINPFACRGERGCVASDDDLRGGAPNLAVDDRQRAAIRSLLLQGPAILNSDTPAEFAQRQVEHLRCHTCHRLDGQDATLPKVIAEEGYTGLPPEQTPVLTWAGEKLLPDFTERLLAGRLEYRPRPHLKLRMPAFETRAGGFAVGLTHQHGFAPRDEELLAVDRAAAELGRALATTSAGLACNRCHAIAGRPSLAPDQAQSTDLAFARNRIRHRFFRRWMRDPLRIDRATKMPRFSEDGVTTPLRQYYDGDARQQFDAIWQYLAVCREL